MRFVILLLPLATVLAQPPDAAYDPLAHAYQALQSRQYDESIAFFLKAIEAAPNRADVHKDLAYTYLKVGENEAARDEFRRAIELDPSDHHVALEYAYLCFETHQEIEARRTFDRLRRVPEDATRATAEQAFQNIDAPLAAGIRRWKEALDRGDTSFMTHAELARFAEQRDDLALAAEHYEKAWRISPAHKSALIALGRVWKALERAEDANAALLAASRGGEPHAAESARELLPARYPYVYEFQNALRLDPPNVDLRREFAFLLLRMDRPAEAEDQFHILVSQSPADLLSAAQLGFLYYARHDRVAASPLFDRVLAGNDEELANRVRAVLHLPQVDSADAPSPKQMAERSFNAGYLKDAFQYLQRALDADPVDFPVMLKLGWTCNLLHDDSQAARWFELARKSPDPEIAAVGEKAWRNLRPALERFRTTVWAFPTYSTRWHDTFSYSQVRTEWHVPGPVHPYLSARLIADTRSRADPANPLFFSESAVILGAGLATSSWHGAGLWGEAGSSIGYLSHHVTPDYRGGLSFARVRGRTWFLENSADALFVSRFQNDGLLYAQNRAGYAKAFGPWKIQFYWNANATIDAKRQYWANFAETGPGVSLRSTLPNFPLLSINLLRGAYMVNDNNPRRPNFFDLRIGVWYALSH